MIRALLFACALGALTSAGCDSSASAVSGTVLMDGKPLAEGEIIFEPADGAGPTAAGPVRDGKYSVPATPGAKKVKVTASRPTKKPDPVMGAAARDPAIGPEYNERTTLTATLKPGTNEGVDFAVKELPK